MTSFLEDKDAIRDLLSEYCHYTDSGEHDKRASLFTEEAIFDGMQGRVTGRKAIEQFVGSIFPSPGGPARKHCTLNSLIKVHGDTAEATSYLIIVREGKDGPVVVFAGR